mmetsp:Transcript_10628/g.40026  ORF Transcript_10628/g.40026 Transcript_10628/m.40026 type:complete len:827 (-) Transcript_10628:426-2906(-)
MAREKQTEQAPKSGPNSPPKSAQDAADKTDASDDDEDAAYYPMAICIQKSEIGIAMYKDVESVILVECVDVPHGKQTDILSEVVEQTSPTEMLLPVSLATNEKMVRILCADENGNVTRAHKVIKSKMWRYEDAIGKLCNQLCVTSIQGQESQHGVGLSFEKLCTLIPVERRSLVGALGALVSTVLMSTKVPDQRQQLVVHKLAHLGTAKHMRLDVSTQRALQIFSKDAHPNLLSGTGRAKEGYSLFALLDRTVTLPGRRCLRSWMQRPLLDGSQIQERLDAVEVFASIDGRDTAAQFRKSLRSVQDVGRVLAKMRKGTSRYPHWSGLRTAIVAVLEIKDSIIALCSRTRLPPLVENGWRSVRSDSLTQCLELLDVVNWTESKEMKLLVVHEGVNDDLDRARQIYDVLDSILNDRAHRILQGIPLLDEIRVEYIPQIGFLVALHKDTANEFIPDNWEFVFEQRGEAFYKEAHVCALDEEVGDIQSEILDLQNSIIREVEERVLQHEDHLLQAIDAVSVLDVLIAFAVVATDSNYSKPAVTADDVIVIKEGRHPLQEITVSSYIPNDTFVDDDNRVALITGPNSSGKSVYVKQVGVIVYLAHIGSFVPATAALVGLTDAIYSRIASRESASVMQSTMTIDLNQVGTMLRNATSRSLLLLDEFGKGTAFVDGLSLLVATLGDLQRKRSRVFATAHLFDAGSCGDVMKTIAEVQLYQMRIVVQDDHGRSAPQQGVDPFGIVPLFKLSPGCANSSYARLCAKKAGVPEPLTTRAAEVERCFRKGELLKKCSYTKTVASKAFRLCEEFLRVADWEKVDDEDLKSFRLFLAQL